MQLLNNLDIIILIVVAVSSFLAFNRGIMKELFSVLGWTLIIVVTVFLLPIINDVAAKYVSNVALVSVIALSFILLIMFVFWIFFTGKVVGKIRESKLSYFDRILGFLFGFIRGIFLVVLFYILVNWITPKEHQADTIKDSVYFEMAGVLAQPIERLIPESTRQNIHEKSSIERFINELEDDSQTMFEKLTQPQIKKLKEESERLEDIKEELETYDD